MMWIDISSTFVSGGQAHLEQLEGLVNLGNVSRIHFTSIWFAGVWCLWKAKNKIFFNGENIEIFKVVEEIKLLVWSWL